MDLDTQAAIDRLVKEHGAERLTVVLGAPDPEAAGIAAETVVVGDPSYAGPLAEAQLGLDVYHVLEGEVRQAVPDDVYEEQVGLMVDVLDADAVGAAVKEFRQQA
jgi:betaine reductase